MLAFGKKIGQILSSMKANTQEEIIKRLNPLLRGFANYYKGGISKKTFSQYRHQKSSIRPVFSQGGAFVGN